LYALRQAPQIWTPEEFQLLEGREVVKQAPTLVLAMSDGQAGGCSRAVGAMVAGLYLLQ